MHLNRNLNLARADSATCPSGAGTYYVCQKNNFSGCCTVDPCGLPSCPDQPSSSSKMVVVTTLVVTPQSVLSTRIAAQATLALVTESSILIQSSAPPSTVSFPSSLATTTSRETTTAVAPVPASVTSTTSFQPESTVSSTPSNHTILVAGVVCGIVTVAILSVLAWFCIRRRQLPRTTDESKDLSSHSKDPALDCPNSGRVGSTGKSQVDVFTAFEGRHKLPQTEPADLADEVTVREEIEDLPLLDLEKTRVKTPPVHEHPAYTSYRPSTASYPSYQTSRLNTHPALRSVDMSYTQSLRSQQSVFTTYQFGSSRPRDMDVIVSPLVPSPLIPSPIAGHAKLQAELPAFYSRPFTSNSTSHTKKPPLSRYSAPVGLGVGISPAPPTDLSLPLSSTVTPPSTVNWNSVHSRKNSITFIPSGGEIISRIQRPGPRSSSNPIHNQSFKSNLQPALRTHSKDDEEREAEEKKMRLAAAKASSTQRCSDSTIVLSLGVTIPSPVIGCLTVADLGAKGQTPSPASAYTDGTGTWGSWAAR
jgi:hypothetical protein